MPGWVYDACQEYCKRLPKDFSLEFVELPLGKAHKQGDTSRAMQQEAESILNQLHKNERLLVLDVKGKPWSTEQLAEQAEDWRQSGQDLAIVIGGPDGLSDQILNQASVKWSLSPLTLPHPLVRVLLAEQIYRAWTILMNHPYHK